MISIYFTVRVSLTIQENEFKFNKELSLKQQENLSLQHKPYPYLHLSKNKVSTIITIQNMGLGPLIINKWFIKDSNENIYLNFLDLIVNNIYKGENKIDVDITYNTAPYHILAPNKEKELLNISKPMENSRYFEESQLKIRQGLKDFEVFFECENIFSEKFTYNMRLDFFG